MLTQHLSGLDPTHQRFQGSLIATHIGEVAVETMRLVELYQEDTYMESPYPYKYETQLPLQES